MTTWTIVFQHVCRVPNATVEADRIESTETLYSFFQKVDDAEQLVAVVSAQDVLLVTSQTAPFRNTPAIAPEAAPLLRPEDPLPGLVPKNFPPAAGVPENFRFIITGDNEELARHPDFAELFNAMKPQENPAPVDLEEIANQIAGIPIQNAQPAPQPEIAEEDAILAAINETLPEFPK